jgi:hypothetical protein
MLHTPRRGLALFERGSEALFVANVAQHATLRRVRLEPAWRGVCSRCAYREPCVLNKRGDGENPVSLSVGWARCAPLPAHQKKNVKICGTHSPFLSRVRGGMPMQASLQDRRASQPARAL